MCSLPPRVPRRHALAPPASYLGPHLTPPVAPLPLPTHPKFQTNSNLSTAGRPFSSLRLVAMQPPSGGAGAGAEEDALLARSDSAGRRRRSSPVQSASPRPPGWGGPRRQSSFRDDVGHAASETYLVTRLAFTLLQCLG